MTHYFSYLKTLIRHKAIVFKLMWKCGYGWQGFWHDSSKFTPFELVSYAKYFYSDNKSKGAQRNFEYAWLHHQRHNPHHWEYWVSFEDGGGLKTYKIPWRYVVEMACDYVAAGIAYNDTEWTQDEPLDYFNKHKYGRYYHKDTLILITKFLAYISTKGVDEFCDFIRNGGSYMYIDYHKTYNP